MLDPDAELVLLDFAMWFVRAFPALIERRNRLASEHMRIVYRVANKMLATHDGVQRLGRDAAEEAGMFGLLDGSLWYDPAKGRPSTYLWRAVKNEIVRAAIANDKRRETPFSALELPNGRPFDPVAREPAETSRETLLVREALIALPAHLREALQAVAIEGRKATEVEISDHWGSVSERVKAGKAWMRRWLRGEVSVEQGELFEREGAA